MGYAQAQMEQYSPAVQEGNGTPGSDRAGSVSRRYGISNSIRRAGLRVGAADDAAEREADQVASAVIGAKSRLHEQDAAMESAASDAAAAGIIQRSAEDGAEGSAFDAGPELADAMGQSAARNLDPAAASHIGSRLGADFSDVRVHTDRHAERVAAGMSARAFTRGKDIYFNRGQYNPGTAAGQELLAHELTHTIQQGQIAQEGGIPVTRTASAQTAQRGFFSLRKHFRKAVDERNEHYEDYKKQSKWTRFKWAVKNPLAWTFGRLKANQQNTANRTGRRDLINSIDPKTALLPDEDFGESPEENPAPQQSGEENPQAVRETERVAEQPEEAPQQEQAQSQTPDSQQSGQGQAEEREEPAQERAAVEDPRAQEIWILLDRLSASGNGENDPGDVAAMMAELIRSRAQQPAEPGASTDAGTLERGMNPGAPVAGENGGSGGRRNGIWDRVNFYNNRGLSALQPQQQGWRPGMVPAAQLAEERAARMRGMPRQGLTIGQNRDAGGDTASMADRSMPPEGANPALLRALELQRQNEALGEKNRLEQEWVTQDRLGKASLGGSIGGGVAGGVGSALTLLGRWNETAADFGANGMGQRLSGWDAFSDFADKSGDVLKDVGGAFSIGGGAAGIAGGAVDAVNAAINEMDWKASGDKRAAKASRWDIVRGITAAGKGVVTIANGAMSIAGPALPALNRIGGALGMVGGGAKMMSSYHELRRTRNVLDKTESKGKTYQQRMDDIAYRRKVIGALEQTEGLPDYVQKCLKAYKEKQITDEKRLQAQAGFMRMGHNTAEVDRLRAKYKMISGAAETVGGAVSLAGGGGVGTAIGMAGTAVDVIGKIHSSVKDTKLKRAEVDRTLDMDKRIDILLEKSQKADEKRVAEKRDPVNMTRREAKHVILREEGLVSRSEAYLSMAKDRMAVLKKLESDDKEERDEMIRSLGLDPDKATDSAIYQRLGLDKKQAANIERAMLKQRKKRQLPSWRT